MTNYIFNELTNIPQLSYSRGYELTILSEKKHNNYIEVPSHQYIYNLGGTKIKFNVDGKSNGYLNPNDSMF